MRDWSSFNNWNSHISDKNAFRALQFLKEIIDEYQKEVTAEKERFDSEKDRSQQYNRQAVSRIKEQEEKAVWALKKAHDESLSEITELQNDCRRKHEEIANLRLAQTSFKGLKKMLVGLSAGTVAGSKQQAQTATQEEFAAYQAVDSALERWRDKQNQLFQEQVKAENDKANRACDVEQKKYYEHVDQIQNAHKRKLEELERQYRAALNEIMSPEKVRAFQNNVRESTQVAENYSCTPNLSDFIYFGDISTEIMSRGKIDAEVRNMALSANDRVFEDDAKSLRAHLPYCQRLDDGISLFLNYNNKNRVQYQEQLRLLLLRLFMSYPAGKVEATMIDPVELGETFSIFTPLGEEQPRIIDTKIWSREQDITNAIGILREKLETVMSSYGEDRKSRLEREPVRILAITDFPTGFSANALRDLQAIVRKSAACGVCIFIWANSDEVEKLQSSQGAVFNEIKQMLHVANADGDKVMLVAGRYHDIRLHFDPMKDISASRKEIIQVLTRGIHSSGKKIEDFSSMYEDDISDPNNWFHQTTIDEMVIPIGIKGAGTVVRMIMGKENTTAHHALIAGQTGSGKSTLLHTIIMSTLLNYSPDEAQLYLVDFKEGVEFKTYSKLNLPSVRLVAIDCEREFGLSVLRELRKEMKRRFDQFKREADRENINDYRKVTGKKVPRMIAIFDEVQELFRESNDVIGGECATILSELLTLGRAAGIHIVLVSQNFDLMPGIKQTMLSHAAIRIGIKGIQGSEENAKSVLGEGNNGVRQLPEGMAGAAVFNNESGKEAANTIFQVAFLEKEKRAELLALLSSVQNSDAYARKYKAKTKVLLTSAEDDMFNPFNQLILNSHAEKLLDDKTNYSLMIGEGFELVRKFKIGIAPAKRQNLLVIGQEEKVAASIFYFSMLSLLYGELGNEDVRKDNQLICFMNLSDEEEFLEPNNTSFSHIRSCFPKQVKMTGIGGMEDMISDTYDTLMRRMEGVETSEERLFLMIFGVNRAHKLKQNGVYEEDDESSALSKLIEIFDRGPQYGINSILWGESLSGTKRVLGNQCDRYFAQHIAFKTDKETMDDFVMESMSETLRDTTAVYMDVDNDVKNTHFRPYEIPVKQWVNKFAKAYEKYISAGGEN